MKKIIIAVIFVVYSGISHAEQLQDNYCTFLELILNNDKALTGLGIKQSQVTKLIVVDYLNHLDGCKFVKIKGKKVFLEIHRDTSNLVDDYLIIVAISQNKDDHSLVIANSKFEAIRAHYKIRDKKWVMGNWGFIELN